MFWASPRRYISFYKSLYNCTWWQFSSAEGRILSSPSYTLGHSSRAVMSATKCKMTPRWIQKEPHTLYNVRFPSNVFSPAVCRTVILSRLCQPSWFSVKVMMTGPGHTKLPALPSLWAGGCLKPNSLHVACKYYFRFLIFERSDRFKKVDLSHW